MQATRHVRCAVVSVTAVLIHPTGVSAGNQEALDHWRLTIEASISFGLGAVAAALRPHEREQLEQLHPSGSAQFWGTHDKFRSTVAGASPDDVVVLTGNRMVLGLGRVGFVADNAALGDALWPHRAPGDGSYRQIYSLAPLDLVNIPLKLFRERADLGNQGFQWPALLTDARARRILEAFSAEIPLPASAPVVSPVERELEELQDYDDADTRVAQDLSWVRELQIEIRSSGDATVGARAASTMHRGESLLVHDWVRTLPPGATWCRYNLPVGVTDLNVHLGGKHELVEAKSSATRSHLRQALGQLLDYAPSLGERAPDSLTVLVPSLPSESVVQLLHRYGVDCVYRRPDGSYERLEAPPGRTAAIAALWTAAAVT